MDDASFVDTIEPRPRISIASVAEIARRLGRIDAAQVRRRVADLGASGCGDRLL